MKNYAIYTNLEDRWSVAYEDSDAKDFKTWVPFDTFDSVDDAESFMEKLGAKCELLA